MSAGASPRTAPVVVLPPPPPRFPNWPWFAALAVVGTAAIMSIPLLYERQYDDMSVAILLGWVGLFNAVVGFLFLLDYRMSEQARSSRSKTDTLQ